MSVKATHFSVETTLQHYRGIVAAASINDHDVACQSTEIVESAVTQYVTNGVCQCHGTNGSDNYYVSHSKTFLQYAIQRYCVITDQGVFNMSPMECARIMTRTAIRQVVQHWRCLRFRYCLTTQERMAECAAGCATLPWKQHVSLSTITALL